MARRNRQRETLLDEVLDIEQDRDEYIHDQVEGLSSLYRLAIEELQKEIEREISRMAGGDEGEIEQDDEAAARLRTRVMRSARGMEELWRRWDGVLDGVIRRTNELFDATGDQVTDAGEVLVQELRGLWPNGRQPGTGTAGRFYNLSVHHRQHVANVVTRGVLLGERRDDLVRELEEVTDRARHQAEQLFHDSTIQFSRSVTRAKAQAAGYEYYQYLGPDDRITRPFCDRIIRGIYTEDEIQRMDNGQTGAGSVFVAGGGYRCRHHWRPVRRRWFSDGEWAELRGDENDAVQRFNTTQDATKYLNETHDVSVVDPPDWSDLEPIPGSRGWRRWGGYEFPQEMLGSRWSGPQTLQALNVIADDLDRLAEQFGNPEIGRGVVIVRRNPLMPKNGVRYGMAGREDRLIALDARGLTSTRWAPNEWRNGAGRPSVVAHLADTRRGEFSGFFRHELCHTRYRQMEPLAEVTRGMNGFGWPLWAADNISARAGVRWSECISEGFVLYTNEDYANGYLPKGLEELLSWIGTNTPS